MSTRPAHGVFSTLVIGGGVAGLATAWHLVAQGGTAVGLVERFRPGHAHGSSHGAARITRTSYGDPLYVRLMQRAHAEDWPRLEADAGRPLRTPCAGAFFGPPGAGFENWAQAIAAAGAGGVERLSPAEARRVFPAFTFADAAGVLHDRTAAVVAAADTLGALANRARVHGMHLLESTSVLALESRGDRTAVVTDRGTLEAERVVIAAGAWTARLVPPLAGRFTVKRQSVGYWRLAGGVAMDPAHFPVWIHLGETTSHYGLPAFGAGGIKAAAHAVAGAPDDPDAESGADPDAIARVEAFLAGQLAVPLAGRVASESCLYTNTADEDFVLDVWQDHPRIVVGSACSGHGFKFAPLLGRILAGLAREGRTDVPEFEAARSRFAMRAAAGSPPLDVSGA